MEEIYHAKRESGLLASTKERVLGFVACSRAYELPNLMNSSVRFNPTFSAVDMASVIPVGSGMMQKLTLPDVSTSKTLGGNKLYCERLCSSHAPQP